MRWSSTPGRRVRDGTLVTAGGRVLNVTALGESLADCARAMPIARSSASTSPGSQYRHDIALGAVHANA